MRQSTYLFLIFATLFWAGNFVVGRAVSAQIPPFTLNLLRWALAVIFVLPFTWTEFRQNIELFKEYRLPVVGMAVTGIVGFNSLLYIALHYTTSINASLVNTLAPIIMSLLSFWLLRERLNLIQIVGIALSLAGVLWIVSEGSLATLTRLSFNPGDIFMFGAVIVWALYSIIIKRYSPQLPAGSTFMLTIAIGVLILMPLSLFELMILDKSVTWSLGTLWGIVYVGVLASVIAFYLWNTAVSKIGPSQSSIFLNLIPLFAAVFATVFLNEQVQWYQIVGAFFVLIGIGLSSRKKTLTLKPEKSLSA